jgi:hypothetical protein
MYRYFLNFYKTSEFKILKYQTKENLKQDPWCPSSIYEFLDERHVMISLDITEYTRALRVQMPWITTKIQGNSRSEIRSKQGVRTEDRGVGEVRCVVQDHFLFGTWGP